MHFAYTRNILRRETTALVRAMVCMQDSFARARTRQAKRARDDRVSCIQGNGQFTVINDVIYFKILGVSVDTILFHMISNTST